MSGVSTGCPVPFNQDGLMGLPIHLLCKIPGSCLSLGFMIGICIQVFTSHHHHHRSQCIGGHWSGVFAALMSLFYQRGFTGPSIHLFVVTFSCRFFGSYVGFMCCFRLITIIHAFTHDCISGHVCILLCPRLRLSTLIGSCIDNSRHIMSS